MTSPNLFFFWLATSVWPCGQCFFLFLLSDVSCFFHLSLHRFLCVHSQVCGLCVSIHLLLSGCVCRFWAEPLRQDSRSATCLTCNFVLFIQTMFLVFFLNDVSCFFFCPFTDLCVFPFTGNSLDNTRNSEWCLLTLFSTMCFAFLSEWCLLFFWSVLSGAPGCTSREI